MKQIRLTRILAFLMLIIMVVWIVEILAGHTPFVDQWTRYFVAAIDSTPVYDFFRLLTHLGSRSFMIPFTIMMAILLVAFYRDWLQAVFFVGGTLLANGLNMLIKYSVQRERPFILETVSAEGFSFPSGHAMITLVSYGLLMYFIVNVIDSHNMTRVVQLIITGLVASIGFSRYVINVHYLTDILSGFIFGYILLIGILDVYKWAATVLRKTEC